jgi:hypothetical protein
MNPLRKQAHSPPHSHRIGADPATSSRSVSVRVTTQRLSFPLIRPHQLAFGNDVVLHCLQQILLRDARLEIRFRIQRV